MLNGCRGTKPSLTILLMPPSLNHRGKQRGLITKHANHAGQGHTSGLKVDISETPYFWSISRLPRHGLG